MSKDIEKGKFYTLAMMLVGGMLGHEITLLSQKLGVSYHGTLGSHVFVVSLFSIIALAYLYEA